MNKCKLLFLLVALLSLQVLRLSAQMDKLPELVTDRPDQTESAVIVPKGYLQVETGFVYEEFTDNLNNTTFHSTLLRYGLLENMELRLSNEYIRSSLETNRGEISQQGIAPFNIGTKIFISEERGALPGMAFMAGVTLPYIGREEFTPTHIAPYMRLAAAHTISENLSLGWNFGGEWSGDDTETIGFYSGVLGIGVSAKLGAFLELYGYLPEDHKADHRFDAGLTYLLMPNLQLDVSGGLGINEVAPDGFINAGVSVRIPN